jgi:hypothetical protein
MEKRLFTRIPFKAIARFDVGNEHYEVELLDISLNGALITQPEDFAGKTGDEVIFDLLLDDKESNIKIEGKIVHAAENRIGIQCHHIALDSITHLRRLVELNLGDPDLLDRELGALQP